MFEELMHRDVTLNGTCPVCNVTAYVNQDTRQMATLVICPTCGKFLHSSMASLFLSDLREKEPQLGYKISYQLRIVSESAIGKKDSSLFPVYKHEDFQRMIGSADLSVQEKLNALLRYVGKSSEYPGQITIFDLGYDYSILNAKNSTEALFDLQALADQKYISFVSPITLQDQVRINTKFPRVRDYRAIKVTAEGWLQLERIAGITGDLSNGFIAMSFDPSRNEFRDAMERGISNAGYKPIRIDSIPHINRIDDEIMARIRQSKFLVADFSGHNNGVYFEAGFMLGLGRPVIWVCEKTEMKDLHFDTRQYNMIDYSDAADLEQRLQLRIEANLGKGSYSDGFRISDH